MKIAFVNQPLDGILPPGQNSIGIWTYEVARRLAADHDVTVYGRYLPELRGRVGRHATDQGVTYRLSFAAPRRIWSRLTGLWDRIAGAHRPIYASVFYYLDFSLPLAVRLRAARPDVIHIHNFTGFVPVIRALNRRSKLVLHMNCEWLSQLDQKKMAKRILLVDEVFGSSGHITNLVKQRFPEFADRCHTVYNGVDPDAFVVAEPSEDDPSEPTIVFVGRVSPEKGIHDLVDAMATVLTRVPAARLDIIGPVGVLARSFIVDVSDDELVAGLARFYDRDYMSTITDAIDHLAPSVRLCGPMSHEDVVYQIAHAALLVNPSYSESFGMSLVEAMACEVPVVATRVGGMKEIMTEQTGILVERGDTVALADAILRLLNSADLRRSMGSAGRRRVVELFSWDRIAESSVERYRALVDDQSTTVA